MNPRMILRLVAKDWSLMRLPVACYTAAALVGLAMAAVGGALAPGVPGARGLGITLALNVMIGASFHVTLGPVLGERERKTLAFVMGLPVRPREVAAAKLLASFLMFLVPAAAACAALVFLSPVDIFGAMAASHRSVLSHVLGWLSYFGLLIGIWTLFFSIVLGAAIVSESIGWTIAILTGTMFVVGNFVLQVAPRLG